MKRLPLITLLALAATGTGCSWWHSNTRAAWQNAVQERPLEVPPDLQRPVNAAALTIPDVPGQPGAGAPAAEPPGTAAAPAGGPQGSAALLLDDTVASAYHRVGLALKRGDLATLQSENAAAHRYQVTVPVRVEGKPQGFFARIFSRNRTREVQVPVTITVVAADGKAQVQLSGGEAAVRQLRAGLQQRLG